MSKILIKKFEGSSEKEFYKNVKELFITFRIYEIDESGYLIKTLNFKNKIKKTRIKNETLYFIPRAFKFKHHFGFDMEQIYIFKENNILYITQIPDIFLDEVFKVFNKTKSFVETLHFLLL